MSTATTQVAVNAGPSTFSSAQLAAGMSAGDGTQQSGVSTGIAVSQDWLQGLGSEALVLLNQGRNDVWDDLTHKFEAQLLRTALAVTHGRRVEAAQRLGIGRNTITRKLQELGLDDEDFDK